MHNINQDIAVLLAYCMQDFEGVEPLECSIPEVKRDDLVIRNTMYKTPKLRKIHLELAELKGLKILHCVFFPDPHYNLPIFGCDIVATDKTVTAAIVDVSPVKGFEEWDKIKEISNAFDFSEKRHIPAWGDDVFSPYAKFMRLSKDKDISNFYVLVVNYLKTYCDLVDSAEKDDNWISTMLRYDDQIYYCKQQKKNDKTRAILEKLFDKDWANNYIDNVLFDIPRLKS
tara:strand:- start:2899 stop:3582 length:684 start_codon:yes stop_codon:yes gene_type:complete